MSRLVNHTRLAAAAAITSAGMAQADGLTPVDIIAPPPPPPSSAADWSGAYGGLSLGYSQGAVDWEDDDGGYFTFFPGDDFDFEMEQATGGLQLGYNWQTANNFVFGLELSGLLMDMEETKDSSYYPATDKLSATIKNPVALTGHVGFAAGRWRPYLEAGVASAQISLKNVADFGGSNPTFNSEERHTGYVAGIGVGYKISDRSAVGINYRHFDFGEMEHKGTTSMMSIDESYDTRANLGVVSVFWNIFLN